MKAMRLFADRSGKVRVGVGICVSESAGRFDVVLGTKEFQRIVPFDKRNPPQVTKKEQAKRPPSNMIHDFDVRMFHDVRMSRVCGGEVKYYLITGAENEQDLSLCVHVDVQGSKGLSFSSHIELDDLPCGFRVDEAGVAASPVALIALSPGDYITIEFHDAPNVTVRYDETRGLVVAHEPVAAVSA